MLFSRILSTITAVATAAATSPVVAKEQAPSVSVADGTLVHDRSAELFTFNYTTSNPFGTNWIGLYPAFGGGPINEVHVSPSTVWQYAPEAEGQVLLSAASLQPGDYRAFFLARDGYQWLAQPVNVSLASPPAELKFPVEAATLHNARQFEAYTANVGNLILGSGNENVRYEKLDGERWITVSSTGLITAREEYMRQMR